MNPHATDTTQNAPKAFHRRSFLQSLGVAAGAAALPSILTTGARSAQAAQDVASDIAILNFALNFEYIEAEYYTRATTGVGIAEFGLPLDGAGTQGQPTVTANSKVPFSSPTVRAYANELAEDERLHVRSVRSLITALGGTPVAFPQIDLLNSFFTLGRRTGISANFNPFSSQENFLLGGFTFSDVTVTALRGSAGLLTVPVVKSSAAGILGTEGYHDGLLRYQLYKFGSYTRDGAQRISSLRDSLDGTTDLDQGVVNSDGSVNLVPTDNFSIALGRTQRQVLNIVYGAPDATAGLFFPIGINP